MAEMKTMKDVRKAVEWKDLRELSRWQVLYNVTLPYPFLALSWWLASQSLYIFALGASFLFFASSFRQAHDGFHNTLGLSKKATDVMLWWSSGLLMTSNHAIRQTHLQHHRAPLDDSDIEARFYKLKWWQAIIGGFGFWVSLQSDGFDLAKHARHSRKERLKIILDFALMGCMALLTILSLHPVLIYHLLVMLVANSFVGFVAGWCVHHDCGEVDGREVIARTERNPLVNLFTFNLLFHMEHHLFPAVPTNHLPELGRRLDVIAPEFVSLSVTPNITLPQTISTNSEALVRPKNYNAKTVQG